jgi:hypothetical protein
VFHTNDMGLEIIHSFNNDYRVLQFKLSTQIIYKILKLKKQNDTNNSIHKTK